jgi:hypothetical protein
MTRSQTCVTVVQLRVVARSTDEPTAEDKLAKYKLALRLPPTSRKNLLLFWRENASEFSLMSATSTDGFTLSQQVPLSLSATFLQWDTL